MQSSSSQFRLPDLLAALPLQFASNSYYKEVSEESRAWIDSYDILPDRKRAFFFQGSSELLCAYTYPYAGRDQLRTVCDFVNLLFVIDEVSDDQTGSDARTTGDVYLAAMKDAEWDDGSTLARITKEFRARFLRHAGPKNTRRFFQLCDEYIDSVTTEAELREQGKVVDLTTYIPLRRNNSAVPLCFALIEHMLGVDLEDEVYQDEDFQDAYWAACDYVCWSNDLYSYDMEQSKGIEGNNVVSVLMQNNGLSLQQAADFVGTRCSELADTYLSAKKRLSPSLGTGANRFITALGSWMIGNLTWSFDSLRYFGAQHLEVKETRLVVLRPKEMLECSFTEQEDY